MAKKNEKKDKKPKFNLSNIFKKKEKSEEEKSSKKQKILIVCSIIALIIIAMAVGVYFRSFTINLPVTKDWARSTAENSIRSQIAAQVNAQYPNLALDQKSKLIEQEFQKFWESNKAVIEPQITASADYFKSQLQNPDGHTYILDIDSYQHYRAAQLLLKNGYPADELRNPKTGEICFEESSTCVLWDNHKIAPLGTQANKEFHIYFMVFFFKFVQFFNRNVTLLAVAYWVPVLLAALCVIPAFFIAKKRVGLLGGFIAAMFVAIHPVFLGKTTAGSLDTDVYVVFFPLFILWAFLEAFEAENWKKRLTLIAIAGFLVGSFAFAWKAWWFTFDIIVLAMLVYLWFLLVQRFIGENKSLGKKLLYFILSIILAPLYIIYLVYLLIIHLKDKNKRKDAKFVKIVSPLLLLLLFLAFSALFVSLFVGPQDLADTYSGPFQRVAMKDAINVDSLWPNVLTTVAELNPASLGSVVNQIGGRLFFILASLGVIFAMLPKVSWKLKAWLFAAFSLLMYVLLTAQTLLNIDVIVYLLLFSVPIFVGLFLNIKQEENVDVKYAILLLLWFVGTMFATTKGTRFTLLLVPAVAVALGIAVGYLYSVFSDLVWKELKVSKIFARVLLIVILLLLLIAPIRSADDNVKSQIPLVSDAWYDSLVGIKDNSAPDAIINSWWDFGHWFKAIADRRVTADGASQNTPMAHWVGKVLITDDEQESVGILRMLDCGSNTAFERLHEYLGDNLIAVDILYEIVVLEDKEAAKKILLGKGLTEAQAVEVLKYTHCEPPENYFITSEDMVGKAGVWGHFGSWNFTRADMYKTIQGKGSDEAIEILKDEFGLSDEEASSIYYTIQAFSSQSEVNSWISPWPNYLSTSMTACTKNNQSDAVVCNYNRGIGVSQDGSHNVYIDKGIFNLTDPSKSKLVVGFYLRGSGAKVGENTVVPVEVVLADDKGFKHYPMDTTGNNFAFSVLIEEQEDGTYRSLLCDPLFVESSFTKLFYMDGRYIDHFDKFSEKNAVTGETIIVWKVDWDGK